MSSPVNKTSLGAGSHLWTTECTAPFFDWGLWSQIWGCWFSSQMLHPAITNQLNHIIFKKQRGITEATKSDVLYASPWNFVCKGYEQNQSPWPHRTLTTEFLPQRPPKLCSTWLYGNHQSLSPTGYKGCDNSGQPLQKWSHMTHTTQSGQSSAGGWELKRLCQTFPADPHNIFGSIRPDQCLRPSFHRVYKVCGGKTNDTTTKLIIELWQRVSWWQVQVMMHAAFPDYAYSP